MRITVKVQDWTETLKGNLCGKCGSPKTLDSKDRFICRECNRANALRHGLANLARKGREKHAAERAIARQAPPGTPALDMFDALADFLGLFDSPLTLSPKAGRLQAGESLYVAKK